MKRILLNKLALQEAIKVLSNNGLVIFPSDTVYGLLADASNTSAVKRLIEFKNRPIGKPISVFVSDMKMMKSIVSFDGDKESLFSELLPGPYTIVLPSKHTVVSLLESERYTLGVRIPRYEPIHDLVSWFGKPITATSANSSGRPPHYSIDALLDELPESKKSCIDLIVDGGELPRNKPSTVLDYSGDTVKMLREGDIVYGETETVISSSPEETKTIAQSLFRSSVGQIKEKPLVFILEGEMGAGKTIFMKGAGEYLGITDIVSPTFVVYYEYETKHAEVNKLIHADLFNVEEEKEFSHLGFESYLKPGTVLCFEWGEKAKELLDMFKSRADVFYIRIEYIDEAKRRIIIKKPIIH